MLGDDGSGAFSGVIAGISWAFQQAKASGRPSVAVMSLGGPSNKPLDTAVRNAINGGLSFAIAAGNENQDATKTSPAGVSEANVVGAVDENNKKARFSNFGSPLNVWAPGVGILSAWIDGPNSAKKLDGTSMAAYVLCYYTHSCQEDSSFWNLDLVLVGIWRWPLVGKALYHRTCPSS